MNQNQPFLLPWILPHEWTASSQMQTSFFSFPSYTYHTAETNNSLSNTHHNKHLKEEKITSRNEAQDWDQCTASYQRYLRKVEVVIPWTGEKMRRRAKSKTSKLCWRNGTKNGQSFSGMMMLQVASLHHILSLHVLYVRDCRKKCHQKHAMCSEWE